MDHSIKLYIDVGKINPIVSTHILNSLIYANMYCDNVRMSVSLLKHKTSRALNLSTRYRLLLSLIIIVNK